jgi:eukaryotic-like serine/threonine-protein kinase
MNQELWRKAEALFHAALDRAPEERAAFLNVACGPDTELRQQVEVLVSKDEQAGSLLEEPVLADLTAALAADGPLVGRQFGSYRILALLGLGGMGAVYRAHDSRLGRDVAIKTLPPEFARDPDRLARSRREARTLASLNHPNIGAIYGLEESGEVDCLVLELVEGDTLHGPFPLAVALDRARQVAEALEAAHERGIIHRDLKPANVKVTPRGRVKVLDFGLATALWSEEKPDRSNLTAPIGIESLTGRIVGTPGYMSPEQARGEKVDQRADIWAFGCLLYELLTGKRAFVGDTVLETIAAVLEQEPDWNALPANTPANVRKLLRECLQKDPDRRLSHIADARRAIEEVGRGRNRWRIGAIAATALAIIAAATALLLRGPARPPDLSHWVQLTKFPDPVSQPALSPDGRMLAFVRSPSTFFAVGQIFVKNLQDGEPRQLTNDNLAKTNPMFSPDGTRIAYTTVDSEFNWDTWVVSAEGGEPQRWRRNVSDLVWTGPRQVLYSERPSKGIVAAEEDLSGKHNVYLPPTDRGVARRPSPSPDGKWVLLAELNDYGDWEPCRVVPMDGNSPGWQVGPPGAACTSGTWSPDGEWIYVTSKAGGLYHIWRQRFPRGELQQLTSGPTEEEGIAVAPDDRSFVTAVALQSASIWLHGPNGERQISRLEGNAAFPKFTPDGRKVCYRVVKEVPRLGPSTYRDLGEVWVADLETGRTQPLVPNFQVYDYDLSPDGIQVVMEADDHHGKPRLWLASVEGRAPPHQIPNVEGRQAVFGPTGEIYFRRTEGQSGFAYRVQPDGTGLRKAIDQPVLAVTGVSPDGQWIEGWALLPRSRTPAVQLFPLRGGRPLIIGSNAWLQWSRDGRFLWLQGGPIADGGTYIIPLPRGEVVPRIPPEGFRSEEEIARLPGARRLEVTGAPGPSPEIYAFEHRTVQRNLYRIPIP